MANHDKPTTMTPRDEMLARIRSRQPAPEPLPALPAFARGQSQAGAAAFEEFSRALERMGGRVVEPAGRDEVAARVRELFPGARVICSATPEVTGNRPLQGVGRPSELDDVDVGVVRAAFGVAETGSVLLTEAHLGVEALGFLAQHLVVLLDPSRIVPTLHEAYQDAAFGDARYTILMTGPSATADIEGVLIRGAQGIRSLTLVPCA